MSRSDDHKNHPDRKLRDLLEGILRADGQLFPVTDEDIEKFEREEAPDRSRPDLAERVIKKIRARRKAQDEKPDSGMKEESPKYPWQRKTAPEPQSAGETQRELVSLFRKGEEELPPEVRKQIEEDIEEKRRAEEQENDNPDEGEDVP